MANVLISYDVSSNQINMKTSLKSPPYNYLETMNLGPGSIVNLPSTTLWKPNSTSVQAKLDMLTAAKALNVTLMKAVAVDFTTASGV